jgi:nucleotide-binding universal stress UspA family protein
MENKIKVLIPTDFSVQGEYAYIMVNNLSKKLAMEVTFLNVLNVPDTVTLSNEGEIETCGEIDIDFVAKQKEMAERKLAEIKSVHGDHIQTDLVFGKTTTGIIKYAEENSFDFIAMGTKGASGVAERIVGSEAQVIARKSEVPVLSLMCDRSEFDLQKIVLVHNFEENQKQELGLLEKLVTAFASEIHLLQITDDLAADKVQEIEQKMDDFAKSNAISEYKKHVLKDEDVENGVIHFNQMNNIDLVCIGTHGTGGFFKSSAAESLINHMYKPVITYRIKS